MWMPEDYSYNEAAIFGLVPHFSLRERLCESDSELEMKDGHYAVLCILDSEQFLQPFRRSTALDTELVKQVFAEQFGPETIFSCVATGRALVCAFRSSDQALTGDENQFFASALQNARALYSSLSEMLDNPLYLSLSEPFSSLEICGQVACEALVMVDFVNFVQKSVPVVTRDYCFIVKSMLEAANPDYRLRSYERPIISSIMNANYAQAEQVINDFIISYLTDPICVFPTLHPAMFNLMRTCQALSVLDPRELSIRHPQYLAVQQDILHSPTLTRMKALIHQFFTMLENLRRQDYESRVQSERIKSILHYIKGHLGDPMLGAPMVCEAFALSTTHFSHIFKEEMGVTFSVFLQTLRITRAKVLLLETDLSLNAIAEQIGYTSGQNLTRLFNRYEGMNPTAYRQAARTSVPTA